MHERVASRTPQHRRDREHHERPTGGERQQAQRVHQSPGRAEDPAAYEVGGRHEEDAQHPARWEQGKEDAGLCVRQPEVGAD